MTKLAGKLHIQLFGDFRLFYRDVIVTGMESPRLQSLLAYLLLHQDTMLVRSQLAYLLWPDSGDSQAHANLRSLLLRLRRLLPEADAFIYADASHIQWRPASPFTLDVANFESHLAAAQIARQAGHVGQFEAGAATMTDFLGGLAWRAGDYQTAVTHHAAAAELFWGLGDLFKEAMALNNLGTAYWSLGDYPQARVTHERALAANRSLGHRRGEADNLDNLGGVAWVVGDYDTAVEFYTQALHLHRQMGDRWGITISLGSAYRLQGKLDKALDYYDEAQRLNREIGRRYGEAYALHGRELTLLEVGRLVEAGEALQAAHAIRAELGEQHLLMETAGALALLHLAAEDLAQAQTTGAEMLTLAAAGSVVPPAALRQWVFYVAYAVYQAQDQGETAVAHLVQAEAAMQEIARSLSEEDASRFFGKVPLNRQVLAAVATHSQVIPVRLVRAGTPPGRKLIAADYMEIAWTIAAPADGHLADPVQRRRHVLQRLLAEAEAQGAVPTADDLATALGVSRRTILRDVKTLAPVGVTLPGSQKAGGR